MGPAPPRPLSPHFLGGRRCWHADALALRGESSHFPVVFCFGHINFNIFERFFAANTKEAKRGRTERPLKPSATPWWVVAGSRLRAPLPNTPGSICPPSISFLSPQKHKSISTHSPSKSVESIATTMCRLDSRIALIARKASVCDPGAGCCTLSARRNNEGPPRLNYSSKRLAGASVHSLCKKQKEVLTSPQ